MADVILSTDRAVSSLTLANGSRIVLGTHTLSWDAAPAQTGLSIVASAVAAPTITQGYTFKELKDAVSHRLGGTPDSRISCGLIVNQAIRRLCVLYSWPWLRVVTTLDLSADSGEIALPADFGRLDSLLSVDPLLGLKQVSVDELLATRNALNPPTNCFCWCISAGSQAVVTTLPSRTLLLAPIPVASVEDALELSYFRSLGNFPVSDAVSSSDDYYPAIPANMHEALWWMVRAVAAQMEDAANAQPDWAEALKAVQEQMETEKRLTPPVARPLRSTRRGSSGDDDISPRHGITLSEDD